jgi:hypothetical protein
MSAGDIYKGVGHRATYAPVGRSLFVDNRHQNELVCGRCGSLVLEGRTGAHNRHHEVIEKIFELQKKLMEAIDVRPFDG